MERKRSPNNISTEELLASLDSKSTLPEIIETPYKNDVLSFVSHFSLQSGPNLVRFKVIKELYRLWSADPINDYFLKYELISLFEHRHARSGPVFFINVSAINIKSEAYKLVESRTIDKTKSKSYKKHYEDFLQAYDLKPGDAWIEAEVLYFFYDKWVFNNKFKSYMGPIHFNNFCKVYFKHKRLNHYGNCSKRVYFAIDKESLMKHTTVEQLENVRKSRLLDAKEKRQKAIKKIKGKVSRTKA